jgi:hypothetical protein
MHLQNIALLTLRGYFEFISFAMSGSPRRFAARDDVRRRYAKPSLFERGIMKTWILSGVIIF